MIDVDVGAEGTCDAETLDIFEGEVQATQKDLHGCKDRRLGGDHVLDIRFTDIHRMSGAGYLSVGDDVALQSIHGLYPWLFLFHENTGAVDVSLFQEHRHRVYDPGSADAFGAPVVNG